MNWSQPRALRRRYELHDARGLVGELRLPGLFSSRARAAVGDTTWDIRAEGLYQSLVRVVRAGTGGAELTFTRDGFRSGGFLDFRGHAPLRARTGTFRRRLLLQTADREVVMRLKYRGLVRLRGTVRFGPERTSHDAHLLAALGWYLVVTRGFQLGADPGIP